MSESLGKTRYQRIKIKPQHDLSFTNPWIISNLNLLYVKQPAPKSGSSKEIRQTLMTENHNGASSQPFFNFLSSLSVQLLTVLNTAITDFFGHRRTVELRLYSDASS